MTGAELADALSASRSKALATLGKAYIRRTDEPDDELFAGIMRGMGLDDEVGIEFLLAAWKVQREYRGEAPAETNGTKPPEPASDKQRDYIAKLADEKGFTAPETAGLSKAQASELIDKLQAGTYNPDTDDVPF